MVRPLSLLCEVGNIFEDWSAYVLYELQYTERRMNQCVYNFTYVFFCTIFAMKNRQQIIRGKMYKDTIRYIVYGVEISYMQTQGV
jgi:hypothetical protein